MDDFVMEIPGAATPEFCQMMIEKYEADTRKRPAMVGPNGDVKEDIRSSVNLEMNQLPEWKGVVDEVRKMLFSRLTKYLDDIHCKMLHSLYEEGYDSSYTMMKYVPGPVGYDWHNDFLFDNFTNRGGVRTVTWLFYLNDVDGGETEFIFGKKVKCETGKLVFFPSDWTMLHRGLPVNIGEKYLCVGWFYSTWNKNIGKRMF